MGTVNDAEAGEEIRGRAASGENSPLPFAARIVQECALTAVTHPEFPEDDEAIVPPREKPMGFFDHIEELRWMLVKCAAVYVLFAAAIGFYLRKFNDLLLWPLNQIRAERPDFQIPLDSIGVAEIYGIIFQVCMLGALAPAAPFIIYFVGKFVAPALREKELRMILPGGIAALVLFLLGAAMGFFLLMPKTIGMSLELNQLMGFGTRWTPASYYNMLMWLVLGVGLAFEFPLLVLLLVYLRILSTDFLKKYRRHAMVAICVIAAVVTPTQDPVTMFLFAGPLYALYEIAVFVGAQIEKRRRD